MKWRAPTILQGHKAKEPGIWAGLKGSAQGQDPEARLFGFFGFVGFFGFWGVSDFPETLKRAPTILQGDTAKEPGIKAGLKGSGQGQDPEARLFGFSEFLRFPDLSVFFLFVFLDILDFSDFGKSGIR